MNPERTADAGDGDDLPPLLVLAVGGSAMAGSTEAAGRQQEHVLDRQVVRLGRGRDIDVELGEAAGEGAVAELHRLPDGGFEFRALSADTPALVNGQPRVRTPLADGWRIEIGTDVLVYRTRGANREGGRQGGELSGGQVEA